MTVRVVPCLRVRLQPSTRRRLDLDVGTAAARARPSGGARSLEAGHTA